jgi:hypothetical protein
MYGFDSGSSVTGANNGVCAGDGAVGCWIVNWLSDKLGRRLAIQIIATIYIISAALPAESDLVTDDEAGTAHQTGRVDVDRLVARRSRVGPSWTMTGRLLEHLIGLSTT